MITASKLAKATTAVGGRLAADKRNTEQGYNYISADKALAEGGQALAEQGITIVPSIAEATITPVNWTSSRGESRVRYDAFVKFNFRIMSDEGALADIPWVGYGVDHASPDKALYKAITSGHKYFLMKLLMIGEGNEDGEHEAAPDEPLAESRPDQTKGPACPKCGGPMWDNRTTKKNPKAPDYRCRDKNCDGVIWPSDSYDADAEFDAMPSASASLPQNQPKTGKAARLATIKTRRFFDLATAFAEVYPHYQNKNGDADTQHICATIAQKLGYADITEANVDEVFSRLTEYAKAKQA